MSYRTIHTGSHVYRVSPDLWNRVKGLVVQLNGNYFPKRGCFDKLMAVIELADPGEAYLRRQ